MSKPNQIIPGSDKLRLLLAHGAYDLKAIFDRLGTGIEAIQVSDFEALQERIPEADVLVVSGLWKNELLERATRLKYLQSISAGINQYDLAGFRERGILLASGSGVNQNAVSDHAMALLLSVTRRMALARDNQHARHWRPDQRDLTQREDELPGKTAIVVGVGKIGSRIIRLCRAFGMHVIGVRRDVTAGAGDAQEVHAFTALPSLLPRADVVILCCPLTEETRNLIDREALALLKPMAVLVNVARGGCVDEAALIEALEAGRLAGAGLDVTEVEPLPAGSKLWSLPNVVLTPHAAGETRAYERNLFSILRGNLDRLWTGDTALQNRVA